MASIGSSSESSPLADVQQQALLLRTSAIGGLRNSYMATNGKIEELRKQIQANESKKQPLKTRFQAWLANKEEKKTINESRTFNANLDGANNTLKKQIKVIEKDREGIRKMMNNLQGTSNTNISKIRKLSDQAFELINPYSQVIEKLNEGRSSWGNEVDLTKEEDENVKNRFLAEKKIIQSPDFRLLTPEILRKEIDAFDSTYINKINDVATKITNLNGIFTAEKKAGSGENKQIDAEIKKIIAVGTKFGPLRDQVSISSEALKIFDEVTELEKIHNSVAKSRGSLETAGKNLQVLKEYMKTLTSSKPAGNSKEKNKMPKNTDNNLKKAGLILMELKKKELAFEKRIPTIKQAEQFEKDVESLSSMLINLSNTILPYG
ncbi:MAG: hypothetical protein H0X29_05895 [Parachlamydiaceae bacterium]|nr:hypothetical protein [Parachlamydiaceae bacterium]